MNHKVIIQMKALGFPKFRFRPVTVVPGHAFAESQHRRAPKGGEGAYRGGQFVPLRLPQMPVAITPPTPGMYRHIARVEQHIHGSKTEIAHFLADDGSVLLEKQGEADHVTFDDSEMLHLLANSRGAIMTHNHPHGWAYPASSLLHQGNSFSPADIQMAAFMQLAEIRAVTPKWVYRMQPPEEGWNSDFFDNAIVPSYERHARQVWDEGMKRARRRGLSEKERKELLDGAETSFYHNVWSRVAADTGVRYAREEWAG